MVQQNYNNEYQLTKQMLDIGKRIWQRDYVAANDGNITVRLNDNEILATATGVSKGFMNKDMILKLDMDGNVLTPNPKHKPSSEVKMHLEVYNYREDVRSVIHAHPPYCTSFAVAGIPLDKCVLPEAILTLGAVPIAEYGTPSTMEIPESVKPHIGNNDAVLLANHGALTLGESLEKAYFLMETLEHTAKIVTYAENLGNVNLLPQEQVDKLMETFNMPTGSQTCQSCEIDPSANSNNQASQVDIDSIVKKVIERLKQ